MIKSLFEKIRVIIHCIHENLNQRDEFEEIVINLNPEKEESITTPSPEKEDQKLIFNNMLATASSILTNAKPDQKAYLDSNYKHPIFSYIKILGLSIQTKYITNLAYGRERLPDLELNQFFKVFYNLTPDQTIWDIIQPTRNIRNSEKKVKLNRDLVLPWPWHPLRFKNALIEIGEHNPSGEWEQDSNNHNISVVQPMGVCFVNGGNHSIMAGVVKGEGMITDYEIIDMTPLYALMYSDGVNYYRKDDNSIIQEVENVEFAAIFEIGRKLNKLNISW
ncbi:hypothetical protein PTI45_03148 [Paenibacillus nuruki]|uniref:Uncharacterized protein n=1 Tax=Paenibacillus nuruki TaxID=1886670 RepID=A0A1E3L0X5_9BACL|nr:DUF6710 family protein [Paenibacillus nuruki]ODP27438.1 hypothetical protein PTI45_03148 [Paenibacillus nuruki]